MCVLLVHWIDLVLWMGYFVNFYTLLLKMNQLIVKFSHPRRHINCPLLFSRDIINLVYIVYLKQMIIISRQSQNSRKMLRAFATILQKQKFSQLSQSLYLQLACKKISDLTTIAQQKLDQKQRVDISASDKILKINSAAISVVINTQTPNRQLWYSSTVSGPQRFDYDVKTEKWVSLGGKDIEEVFVKDLGNFQ